MNIEIEIKIQISEDHEQLLAKWLTQNAIELKTIHHVEHYLNNPNSSFIFISENNYKDARDFLRIRFSDKEDSICFKHWHEDSITKKLTHCDEYETKIADGKIMLDLLRSIGYTDDVIIDKVRTVYKLPDFEISVDKVKELGKFVEIELLKDVNVVSDGLKMINKLLLDIGIKHFKKMDRGYVSMIWNPDYNFGEEINLA